MCKILKDYMEEDELNIEQIVKDYSGYIYTIIKNTINQELSNEDIEELISDTFLVLWNNAHKLSKSDKISSYLAGVVSNLIKKKKRKKRVDFNIEDYENILQGENEVDQIYDRQEKMKAIEGILSKMSEVDKEIFELFYYTGKKCKEIAKMLNISEFAVKTKLHRIRNRIRKSLEKGGYRYE